MSTGGELKSDWEAISHEATVSRRGRVSALPWGIRQQYQQQHLMRWNGQLPQYSLGGDNGVFLQLPGGIQK
jgi:hypothetical protein